MKLEDIFGKDLSRSTINFLNSFPFATEAARISKENLIEKDIETINNIREQILSSKNSEILWEEPLSSRVILFLSQKGYSLERVCVKAKHSCANVSSFKISWED